ncbi:MAG: ribonuclease D [Propionibacteriaceae bacterium]|jgi:ribonuclease D|nr:ribonuclease D [Propionibacteriaceae bacterium]
MTDAPAELPLLTKPAAPFGPVIRDHAGLADLVTGLASGDGPVGLDAERAGGFRYHSWAYLIQLKTPETGIKLIDPIALTDSPPAHLPALGAALAGREWILHAASQDLPCLAELGLLPDRLFDTELAARLVGRPRVGLGPLVEDFFGVHLLKEHGAADWSSRPLPADWLNYAALDVELLHELRDRLAGELAEQGKTEWAEQEFQHWMDWARTDHAPREDPWRRTAGIHLVHSARGLALVRELWTARDALAAALDLAPGRLLADRGISDLAALVHDGAFGVGADSLGHIEWFHRRQAQKFRPDWLAAVARAEKLGPDDWPPLRRPSDGPPAPRGWKTVNPPAARRWEKVRPAVNRRAEELNVPPENLIQPDALRRLVWEPEGADARSVDAQLADLGARAWQRDLVTPVVVTALAKVKAAPAA